MPVPLLCHLPAQHPKPTHPMKLRTFYLFAVCLLLTKWGYSQNMPRATVSEEPKIHAVGVGSVTTFPNAAQITFVLKFNRPVLREAINESQKTAADVQAILKKYVKDTSEIKVSFITSTKTTRYDQATKKEVFAGFEVSQKIIFTLKELTVMQDLTEEILKTRIHSIERVSYLHTNAASFVKQAQELAVSDAMETTERLARASNVKRGKIIYLETSSSPADGIDNTVDSYHIQTYSKGMGGRGVSSSGQLITYSAQVIMFTQID